VVNYRQCPRVASGFGCSGVGEYSIQGGGIFQNAPLSLVDNVVLADGSKYTFAYEPTPTSSPRWVSGAVTGRLASVTLPTGGTITYGYPNVNDGNSSNGINCTDGTTEHLTRTTLDGIWSYDRAFNRTSHNYTT
jgi:hypothetical protein